MRQARRFVFFRSEVGTGSLRVALTARRQAQITISIYVTLMTKPALPYCLTSNARVNFFSRRSTSCVIVQPTIAVACQIYRYTPHLTSRLNQRRQARRRTRFDDVATRRKTVYLLRQRYTTTTGRIKAEKPRFMLQHTLRLCSLSWRQRSAARVRKELGGFKTPTDRQRTLIVFQSIQIYLHLLLL